MKFESRPVVFALVWGGSFVLIALLLALNFPPDAFFATLFPASLLWLFLPFLALYVRRRLAQARK